MKYLIYLALIALAVTACSSSGGGTITVNGTETVAVGILDGTSPGEAYPDISDGGQVTVVDSSSKVIGTGSLSEQSPPSGDSELFGFTVTVPDGLDRYGIQVGNHNRGTVWFTLAQMKRGPALCLGDGC